MIAGRAAFSILLALADVGLGVQLEERLEAATLDSARRHLHTARGRSGPRTAAQLAHRLGMRRT